MKSGFAKTLFLFLLGFLCVQNSYSQKFQHSIHGGANLPIAGYDFKAGVTLKYEFEFALNKYFALGISPTFNIVFYNTSTYDFVGTTVSLEKEMDIASGVPSLTLYPKIYIPISDELSLFASYGISGYSSSSTAHLTTVDYLTSEVDIKRYKSGSMIRLGIDASVGLLLDYSDKFDLIGKLSWSSADVGHSMNSLEFNGDWPGLNFKSSIISATVGIAFPLFYK